MHSRFDQFRKTELGGQLEALIDSGDRYIEFAALSRAGVAAIAAIVDDVKEKFPELATDITARQFCGAMVAEVRRRNQHQVVRPRGRVSGGIFAYGAVFTPRPVALSFADRVVHLRATPRQLADRIRAFPEPVWTRRPEGTGFSVVEHLCHLRDLNVIAGERIRLVVTLPLPPLSSVDGTALAKQRAYQKQDAKAALSAFRRFRSDLCDELQSLSGKQRLRCGVRDEVRRMSIDDLVTEMYEHDQTHLLELDELAAEFELA
jgi:DinB superfamily